MSQQLRGKVKSFTAGETLTAGLVAYLSAANTVALWITSTASIVGVVEDDAAATNSAVGLTLDGTAKVVCGASVSAGAVVGPMTASAKVVERANPATTTTAFQKTLGIALEAGSTDAVIEVALQINNHASL